MIREFAAINDGFFRNWTATKNSHEFKRLTLIYGPNGSGKSTLARAIFATKGGSQGLVAMTMSRAGGCPVPAAAEDIDRIYVFCDSFIAANHSLSRNEASLSAIITVGERTIEQERQIDGTTNLVQGLQNRLGAEEQATKQAENQLEKVLQRVSEEVVVDLTVLGGQYQSRSRFSKRSVAELYDHGGRAFAPLSDAEYPHDRQLIASQAGEELAPEAALRVWVPDAVLSRVRAALSSALASVGELDTLVKHPHAEDWVRQGLELHGDTDQCIFCAGPITEDRRTSFAQHFSDEVNRLTGEVDDLLAGLSRLDEAIEQGRHAWPKTPELGADCRAEYTNALREYEDDLRSMATWVTDVRERLETKRAAIVAHVDTAAVSEPPVVTSDRLSALLDRHNDGVRNHASLRAAAGERIRDHHLANHAEEHLACKSAVASGHERLGITREELKSARAQLARLQNTEGDPGPSAEFLTSEVSRLLGRSDLGFEPVGADKYLVTRNGEDAGGLSEGERKAITLVHFLELVRNHDPAKGLPIVIIDDPVSSLDTDSFAGISAELWALLQGVRPSGTRLGEAWIDQLIVFTHSFDFFRQWDIQVDYGRNFDGKGMRDATATYELRARHRDGKRQPQLSPWPANPKQRKKVRSGYHHAFMAVGDGLLELKQQADSSEYGDKLLDAQLLFPNVIRRVLETFLAFKLPGSAGNLNAMMTASEELVTADNRNAALQTLRHDLLRYSNAASHDTSPETDRVLPPDEIPRAMTNLFRFMKMVDSSHFQGMCEATGFDPATLLEELVSE